MLDAVRRYAIRVLLIHAVLLILVVFFVVGAARQVRDSARQAAQDQSKENLQLLADLSARGVDSIYGPIISNLDVYLREEPATSAAPSTLPAVASAPAADRGGRAGGGRGGAGGRNQGNRGTGARGVIRGFLQNMDASRPIVVTQENFSNLWKQLKGSVSGMFLMDLSSDSVVAAYPETSQANAMALSRQNSEWLKKIKEGAQMSSLELSEPNAQGERTGYHLIAVPVGQVGAGLRVQGAFGAGGPGGGGPGPGPDFPPGASPPGQPGGPAYVVVVVVPLVNVENKFLDLFYKPDSSENTVSKEHVYNAILLNREGVVLASNGVLPTGSNLFAEVGESAREDFRALVPLSGDAKTTVPPKVLNKTFEIGTGPDKQTMPPQIIATAPLAVSLGRNWVVLISSPLSEADTVVNNVFKQALLWAVFVTLSVTAILVSTSFFMIKSRVRLERTRHEMLTRELEQARNIQLAWLPDLKTVPPGIDVSAANLPASHISGDFYNWFPLPRLAMIRDTTAEHEAHPKIAVVIGDVTGHGMAAAFLMATTQLLVRMTLSRYHDTARCLREVNQQLCTQSGTGFKGQFVTMLVMILDPVSNTVQIATAGHPTPLVETSDGVFESLEMEPQLVLGVNHGEEYQSQTFSLDSGASLILYTDGLVEAEAGNGQQYGVKRLIDLLQAQSSKTDSADIEPATRIRAILEDVKRFAANRELLDDVTLVALRTSTVPATSVARV